MIGFKLDQLMKRDKVSAKELADKIEVDPTYIYHMLKNRKSPSLKAIQNIAGIFNVSIDYLLEGVANENQANSPSQKD